MTRDPDPFAWLAGELAEVVLGQGEALVVGVSSPMPLPVAINRPARPPAARSADYENHWG